MNGHGRRYVCNDMEFVEIARKDLDKLDVEATKKAYGFL